MTASRWVDAVAAASSPGPGDDGGRLRIAPTERNLRAVHQAALRAFAARGRPPSAQELQDVAAPYKAADVLAELAAGDFLWLDDTGLISACYPFSAGPTSHVVEISGAARVFAMCAIDALGVSAMLGTDVLISSADPATAEPIVVAVTASGDCAWQPASTVVVVGQIAGECAGPSAAVCCGYINFFASRPSARSWIKSHPEISGSIFSQSQALEAGQCTFGGLLG